MTTSINKFKNIEYIKGKYDFINNKEYKINNSYEWKEGYSDQAIKEDIIYNKGFNAGILNLKKNLHILRLLDNDYEINLFNKAYNAGYRNRILKRKRK